MSATEAPTTSSDAIVGKLDTKLEVQIIPGLVANGEDDRLVPMNNLYLLATEVERFLQGVRR
jgi:hypothetical protein